MIPFVAEMAHVQNKTISDIPQKVSISVKHVIVIMRKYEV